MSLSIGEIDAGLLASIKSIDVRARENGYERGENNQWRHKINIRGTVTFIEELVSQLSILWSTS